ncbi:MAG: HTH domain-containing protein [Rubellimicrobium sp.]|nr:HTH domain-containing protein [Rubellimicrobium sp.]
MPRHDRQLALIALLQGGGLHRAEDMAAALGVSVRTIYRDLDRLAAAGVPVAGVRGQGYAAQAEVTLPPLDLTLTELEALHLGLAVVGEAGDGALAAAAETLWAKIDAHLADDGGGAAAIWAQALAAPGAGARALRHLPAIRAALKARQKLALALAGGTRLVVRPLELSYWGRRWLLVVWSEGEDMFRTLDPTAITELQVLPQLFVDEPGRSLADFRKG